MFLENKIPADAFGRFKSLKTVMTEPNAHGRRNKWIISLVIGVVIVLCLPWTQNIQSIGQISTLNPKQRPQQINSVIAGRISQWRVKDGQLVQKGDTLALITEIKEEYLDPSQLTRMDEQIKAKDASVDFYKNKADATSSQAITLEISRKLKLSQLANKVKQYTLLVQSDSISYLAAANQYKIA